MGCWLALCRVVRNANMEHLAFGDLWDVGLPCAVLCAMRTWSTWLLILYGMLAYLVLCCAISGMLSSSFNNFTDIFIGIN
jgi:hypothetical protein